MCSPVLDSCLQVGSLQRSMAGHATVGPGLKRCGASAEPGARRLHPPGALHSHLQQRREHIQQPPMSFSAAMTSGLPITHEGCCQSPMRTVATSGFSVPQGITARLVLANSASGLLRFQQS